MRPLEWVTQALLLNSYQSLSVILKHDKTKLTPRLAFIAAIREKQLPILPCTQVAHFTLSSNNTSSGQLKINTALDIKLP